MVSNVSPKVLVLNLILSCLALPTLPMNAAESTNTTSQLATFGGGCFWCTEAIFKQLDGVQTVKSGYAGGTKENPTYKEVTTGRTGHAEVIQIAYDPAKVTYAQLLDLFWQAHDPTTPNRQGADIGPQYRSIILFHDEGQKQVAEQSKREAAKRFKDPIITQIVPFTKFYPAEGYHQDYYANNPTAPYCRLVIKPKLDKVKIKSKPKNTAK